MTSQSLEEKLKEHNQGATSWSRGRRPFELIYSEELTDKETAIRREKFFKTGNGRLALNRIIDSYHREHSFCATRHGAEKSLEVIILRHKARRRKTCKAVFPR